MTIRKDHKRKILNSAAFIVSIFLQTHLPFRINLLDILLLVLLWKSQYKFVLAFQFNHYKKWEISLSFFIFFLEGFSILKKSKSIFTTITLALWLMSSLPQIHPNEIILKFKIILKKKTEKLEQVEPMTFNILILLNLYLA
jgi:hypothetical protein